MANWCELSWAVRQGPVLVNLDNAVSIRQAPNDERYFHKGRVTRINFSEGGGGDCVDVIEDFEAVQALVTGRATETPSTLTEAPLQTASAYSAD